MGDDAARTGAPAGPTRQLPVPVDVVLAVLDGLPGMVGCWDRDLRNVVANRAYVEYFGLTPETIAGMHIRDVLGAELYSANQPFIERALAGEQQQFDRTIVDMHGRDRHTQVSYVPSRRDGVVNGFFVLVTDVTERVNAERQTMRSAEQYRALAASVPDGFVLLFDTELRFQVAEGAELPAFGHTSDDLEGRTVRQAFPAWLAAELEPRYRAALRGERVEWERRVADRVFSLKAGPVSTADGEIFAGMVIAQDVTAQRRAQAIEAALHEIATSVARHASAEMICAQIAINLNNIFNADTAAVVRFTEHGRGEIVTMAPVRPESVARELVFTPDDWSATAEVAKTGRPALVTYRPQHDGVVGALRAEGFVAGAAAPIHHEGALWGAIALCAQDVDRLTRDVLAQLVAFAELVEIGLGNLTAWSSLNAQAASDPLTGLPNRRTLDAHLARELEACRRSGAPLSVIVIDIDHFKHINDTFGHHIGDEVIVEVGRLLAEAARGEELVARTGGEEFTWVLPRTDVRSAGRAAERARRAVERHEFGRVGAVTVSLGVCATTEVAEAAALTRAADEALYCAKRAGRNRVMTYSAATFAQH